MDMKSVKQFLTYSLRTTEYRAGVEGFMRFAIRSLTSNGKLRCPCMRCVNNKILNPDDVNYHLLHNGIMKNYSVWSFHGEIAGQTSNPPLSESVVRNDTIAHSDMRQLVHDAYGDRSYDPNLSYSFPNTDQRTHGPNREAKTFYSLLEDADKELWPGCELSRLSFLVLLFHTKSSNKWTDKSFNELLGHLQLAIPKSANLPKSYAQAKKIIEKLGLGYVKIHSCPNHCQLFWKDKANDNTCSVCGASRWKEETNQTTSIERKKKKGIPTKVLRYFPLKPRLKRLFMSKRTASLMRWHEEERPKDDVLRHPADSEAWKNFDSRYPEFCAESRNVRLGLASDGFNPFGTLSSTYSCWPIVLVPYNLPPWMCLKQSSLILSTLIPGPTSPGNKIDVYMQPLIEELLELWNIGSETYDASKDESFTMRAGLLWTISDFIGYGMLSGWSVYGEKACPFCNSETESKWLKNGHKYCFMGHRRFLDLNHEFRFNMEAFNGEEELRDAPQMRTGTDELCELEEILDFNGSNTWKKRNIFWSLPYWESHLIRHNLDVMHIEKNVCDNIVSTLLNFEKSKDNLNARLDLMEMGIRKELHPKERGSTSKMYLPPAPYTMSKEEKQSFCKILQDIKVPNGYARNISKWVNLQNVKLYGLKSHDCHILMQQILPIALRGMLSKDVVLVLFDLCSYFRDLCCKNVQVDEFKRLESHIPIIMCHLEMLFPPSFFTVMAHLVIHLATQAKLAGLVCFRWMYFIERYLGSLKSHVRNKAHPEGSIAEAVLAYEFSIFCSHYLEGFDLNFRLHSGITITDDVVDVSSQDINEKSFFPQAGKPLGKPSTRTIPIMSKIQAHRYVLFNCPEVSEFLKEHAAEVRRRSRPRRLSLKDLERIQHETFHEWFSQHVAMLEQTNGVSSLKEEVRMLARGPLDVVTKYQGYTINGFTFRAKRYDKCTQNSGVVVIAKTSSYASSNDRNPVLGDVAYYGRVVDIIKLKYLGGYSVVLFKCEWADATSGRGIKQDEYGFTLVNFSRMTHTGERLEDEPYIFAAQAEQVFYIQDHIDPSWFVVIKMKPQDAYDLGADEMREDRESEPYHITFINNLLINEEGNYSWVRRGVEGTEVDPN